MRYLTNHSTGKMGYAIARMAMLRGLRSPWSPAPPPSLRPPLWTWSLWSPPRTCSRRWPLTVPTPDMIFKAAAVADYTPIGYSNDKVKKKDGDLSIPPQAHH